MPDDVAELTSQSLALAKNEGVELVTADIVERAQAGREGEEPDSSDACGDTVKLNGIQPAGGKLVFRLSGKVVKEMRLRQGHTLIGRGMLCDVRVASPTVSRQHALICHTPENDTVIDLGSTNGTCVDGYPVTRHELGPGETISVGDCTIEYRCEREMPGDAESDTENRPGRASLN